jgi:hypothetical protein
MEHPLKSNNKDLLIQVLNKQDKIEKRLNIIQTQISTITSYITILKEQEKELKDKAERRGWFFTY